MGKGDFAFAGRLEELEQLGYKDTISLSLWGGRFHKDPDEALRACADWFRFRSWNADLLIANESDMDLLAVKCSILVKQCIMQVQRSAGRETLYRLGKAYGAEHMNVYAITSSILITMEFRGMEAVTQSRRIRRDAMDLSKLNHLYRLCCDCIDSPIPVKL